MATNRTVWVRNDYGATEPYRVLGSFQAGVTAAVKRGEILELTADSSTKWVPMDSDFAGSANVAVSDADIASGDLAGYYPIIIPRPGDVFEFKIDTAAATTVGTAMYWSDSETLSASGSNILAYSTDQAHYPNEQNHMSKGGIVDNGTTIKVVAGTKVLCKFKEAVSYDKKDQVA